MQSSNVTSNSSPVVMSLFDQLIHYDETDEYHLLCVWCVSIMCAILVGASSMFPLILISITGDNCISRSLNINATNPNADKRDSSSNVNANDDGDSSDASNSSKGIMKYLLSFAVGGLLGDVFLHLLPEGWNQLYKSGVPIEEVQLKMGFFALCGIFTFSLIETIFLHTSESLNQQPTQLQSSNQKSTSNNKISIAKPNKSDHHKDISICTNHNRNDNANQTIHQTKANNINGNINGNTNGNAIKHRISAAASVNQHQSSAYQSNGINGVKPISITTTSSDNSGDNNGIGVKHLRKGGEEEQVIVKNKKITMHTRDYKSTNLVANGTTKTNQNVKITTKDSNQNYDDKFSNNSNCAAHTNQKQRISPTGYLNLLANAIDNFTHGLAVGASFLVNAKMGLLTTFAIMIHEIPHEIGDFAILLRSGFSKWEALKAQVSIAGATVLGAIAALCADHSNHLIGFSTAWILPFTSGGFLFIALSSLLPELKGDNLRESLKQLLCITAGIGMMHAVGCICEESQ